MTGRNRAVRPAASRSARITKTRGDEGDGREGGGGGGIKVCRRKAGGPLVKRFYGFIGRA